MHKTKLWGFLDVLVGVHLGLEATLLCRKFSYPKALCSSAHLHRPQQLHSKLKKRFFDAVELTLFSEVQVINQYFTFYKGHVGILWVPYTKRYDDIAKDQISEVR